MMIDVSMFQVNSLIQWHCDSNTSIERILYVDLLGSIIVTFDITIKSTAKRRVMPLAPTLRTAEDIVAALANGAAHMLDQAKDPYAYLTQIREEDIPEAYRKRRDTAWESIASLVLDEQYNTRVAFFDPHERHQLILSVAKPHTKNISEEVTNKDTHEHTRSTIRDEHQSAEHTRSPRQGRTAESTTLPKHSKKIVYEWCRKWWRGGMVANALLPYWKQCGPKQGKRNISKKLGRPSQRSRSSDQTLGINVDPHIQDLLIRGYKRFFNVKQQYPWKHAYQRTMELFFNSGVEKLANGVLVPLLLPIDERPTLAQFKWYAKRSLNSDYVAELKRLFGLNTFNLKQRAVLGNSTQLALGPMMVYEVDAWIGDVYLVSAFNRAWIIGKPVVYIIKDVFSRLIVGFSVSLEGPNWTGATLALVNVVTDKVELCKKFNIDITPEMWPTADLPQRILADRGEFEGYNASTLENAFGVQVANTSPYRGDMKAIVERDFLIIKNETVVFIPGFTNYRVRDRGQKDYRLDACLTLDEFRQVLIRHILYYNNVWRMKEYRLDAYAIRDEVPPVPIRLWNWGIAQRTGWRREPPSPERVRRTLLPRAMATSTERGLLFKGMHYTIQFPDDPEHKRAEEIFVRARVQGRQRFEVAFDHRIPQTIYVCLENDQHMIPCTLLPGEASLYGRNDLDLYDVADYLARRKNDDVVHRDVGEQEVARINAENEALYARAQAEAKTAQSGLTKTALLQDIRDNRRHERHAEARIHSPGTGGGEGIPQPVDVQPKETSPNGYVAPAGSIAMLKSLLDDEADAQSAS